MKKLFKYVHSYNRGSKILILNILDCTLICFSLFFSFYLRLDISFIKSFDINYLIILPALFFLSFLSSYFSSLYKLKISYFSSDDIKYVLFHNLILSLFLISFAFFSKDFMPRSVPLIFLFINFSLFTLLRLFLSHFFLSEKIHNKKNIALYGAGELGKKILHNLKNSQYKVKFLVDDDKNLQNIKLNTIDIISPKNLDLFIKTKNIDEIWITVSNVMNINIANIKKKLSNFNIPIKIVPSTQSQFVENDLTNLFDKKSFFQYDKQKILENFIYKKVIIITGAGGSIGSEISRQLLQLKPKKLILIDNSETQLFSIYNDLLNTQNQNKLLKSVKLIPHMKSITQKNEIKQIFTSEKKIDILIHAAAKKHVNLLDQSQNIKQAFKTNVYGTYLCLKLSLEFQVENFLLISTDKAVNPTNIMGLSKRCAELLVKYFNYMGSKFTKYKVVRFGNVIGSSGSALPIFINQIKKGGPITLTDRRMRRYFISIQEAVYLVLMSLIIQSKEGYLFFLDMGKEIKIYNLLKKIVQQMGYNFKSKKHPDGLKIKFTGKKRGEKFREDLLNLYESEFKTDNERIKGVNDKLKVNKAILSIAKNCENFHKINIIRDLKKLNDKSINFSIKRIRKC